MPLAANMKSTAGTLNDIVSSYETKIRSVGAIFDTTHQLLQTFQDSFLDTKQQREKLKAQLREILAKNGSLRKKDFDHMMQQILSNQDQREKQVRELLNSYLNGQKAMAHSLRNNLAKIKDALAEGRIQRAREFQAVIKDILANQEERKQQAIFKLREFQEEQRQIAKSLEELLAKGTKLRAKDLKLMLAEFKRKHKGRTVCQQGSRRTVRSLPVADSKGDEFKARRPRAARSRLATQGKT